MFGIIGERIRQKKRTINFPDSAIQLPPRYRGKPIVDQSKCKGDCKDCIQSCPVDAISKEDGKLKIDLGKCLFCLECVKACTSKAITFSNDYRLSVRKKEDLILEGELKLADALSKESLRLFGRSLKLRQVSAGGCNGCESDTNVLNTIVFDLGRFGIQFVASPRHADGLLITGPITKNMELALKKTYDAIASPKIVIAVGACSISGGPFLGYEDVLGGADKLLPVDLYVPGCPPHPLTILDGLLRLLGKIKTTD